LEKDRLIALGLEGRGRSRAFEVTKKGKVRLREVLPLWKQAQETLRRSLGDRDWANVHNVLDRLIERCSGPPKIRPRIEIC